MAASHLSPGPPHRPTIALSGPGPVTVVRHWVEVQSAPTLHRVGVTLDRTSRHQKDKAELTWAHFMKPLQLSGSGKRPSSTEQSTLLPEPHTGVGLFVVVGDIVVVVVGGGGGVGGVGDGL